MQGLPPLPLPFQCGESAADKQEDWSASALALRSEPSQDRTQPYGRNAGRKEMGETQDARSYATLPR